jgi:hypothetical protein
MISETEPWPNARTGVPHDVAVEAQCDGGATHELGSGDGVCARKQGHLVAESDEFIREIGNNSLSSAVKPRRHTLHKRRDLRNFHFFNSSEIGYGANVRARSKPRAKRRLYNIDH